MNRPMLMKLLTEEEFAAYCDIRKKIDLAVQMQELEDELAPDEDDEEEAQIQLEVAQGMIYFYIEADENEELPILFKSKVWTNIEELMQTHKRKSWTISQYPINYSTGQYTEI